MTVPTARGPAIKAVASGAAIIKAVAIRTAAGQAVDIKIADGRAAATKVAASVAIISARTTARVEMTVAAIVPTEAAQVATARNAAVRQVTRRPVEQIVVPSGTVRPSLVAGPMTAALSAAAGGRSMGGPGIAHPVAATAGVQ